MKFSFFNSIGKKILIPNIALAVALLIGLGFLMGQQSNSALKNSIEKKQDAIGNILSQAAENFGASDDFADLNSDNIEHEWNV